MGAAQATLVIGAALYPAADILGQKTGVADHRFEHLCGLDAMDAFVSTLMKISNNPVPKKIQTQRAQLQDAMLDAHFMIGQARVAIAADPDVLKTFSDLLVGLGADIVAAVSPAGTKSLKSIPTDAVKIGDLEDLEHMAAAAHAELLVGNSHCVASASRLKIPVLRVGFPQFDILGGFRKTWMGYGGTRDAYFEIANLMLSTHKGEVEPYASIYAQRTCDGEEAHGHCTSSSHCH
jgi:nitrogenase molybdenum-iron protein NifN